MRVNAFTLTFAFALSAITAPAPVAVAAREKIALVLQDRAEPGQQIVLSQDELIAFVREEIPRHVPEGIRNAQLKLSNGAARGSALIDFVKLRHARGTQSGWLLRKLLDGERQVHVDVNMVSGGGKATVYLKRVEIDGVLIEGRPLDFMINTFVRSLYPNIMINEAFELDHAVERIELWSGVAKVVIDREPPYPPPPPPAVRNTPTKK